VQKVNNYVPTMSSTLPASALSSLLRVRLGNRPLEDVLLELARVAQECVPGADEVSVTLVRDDRAFTAAYTGPMALEATGRASTPRSRARCSG